MNCKSSDAVFGIGAFLFLILRNTYICEKFEKMSNERPQALNETKFTLPGQSKFYKGKVRDVYTVGNQLIIVASDRISAFDYILPKAIPYKGQVLNQIAALFLKATKDICPNWLEATPDPVVSIGKRCEAIPIEMVVRGYLTGHAWRVYKSGKRILCGVPLPEGLKEHDRLPHPIITPATKADSGHDEDISAEEILKRGIVSKANWQQLSAYALALYARGTEMAKDRGLILVDTKYEFGFYEGEILLIDEIHTPDSSRYFYLEGYEESQSKGEGQKQLSKEFVREWLMAHGFQGLEDQLMPILPDVFVDEVTERYIELFETITGQPFERVDTTDVAGRIERNILNYLQKKA